MKYEWDADKAAMNLAKHGVDFADAAVVLDDPLTITERDPSEAHEERWATIGMDVFHRLLVVIWTKRGETIRIISARKATPREKRAYEG